MARIIKFRAWDDINKQMIQHENIAIGLKNINSPEYGKHQFDYLQFTGLQDSKGVDIYEGDIVKIFTDDEKENFELWEVVFKEAAFKISYRHIDEQTKITSVFLRPLESDESFYSHELYKIVGNIFDTP